MVDSDDWFKSAFENHYLDIYAHRNDHAAALEMEWIVAELGLTNQHRVLDLACGTGRHSVILSSMGATVFGLDLSRTLLCRAATRRPPTFLLCGDMRRLALGSSTIDAALSLFTSFGYFQTDEENNQVLVELSRVLVSGGRFCLDFLNAPHVKNNLVATDKKEIGQVLICQDRRITHDGLRVEKRVVVIPELGPTKKHVESVRLYELGDFRAMIAGAGLKIDQVFGDLSGSRYGPDSERLVLVGSKQ